MRKWVLILLVCVLVFLWLHQSPEEQAARRQRAAESAAQELSIRAYLMSERFVKQQLRAPATAIFPSITEAAITYLGAGRFFIAAHVDAENGFGALIRSPFNVTLRYVGNETWEVERVHIGR